MASQKEKYNIIERKDGRYEIRETIDGVRKSFYGKTQKEVIEKYKNYKAKNHIYGTTFEEKVHFDEYILQWLYTVKQRTIKTTSFERLESSILNWVNPTIGHIPVNKLTPIHIQELLVNKMLNEGLSLSSIKKAYVAVNGACKYGVGSIFVFNPCDKVTLPAKHFFEKKEIRFLSSKSSLDYNGEVIPSEIERFKTEATKIFNTGLPIHKYGLAFIFILNTGLRSAEIRGLTWDNVDIENKRILICNEVLLTHKKDKDGKKRRNLTVHNTTKTKSSNRYVPLNKTAIACLDGMKEIFGYDSTHNLVIRTRNNLPISPENFTARFKEICKRADIRGATIHSLRHTFATQLFERKMDVKVVSSLLGHADTKITYDTYIHIVDEQKSDAVLALDEEI